MRAKKNSYDRPVLRGGAWRGSIFNNLKYLRLLSRNHAAPEYEDEFSGFRLVVRKKS